MSISPELPPHLSSAFLGMFGIGDDLQKVKRDCLLSDGSQQPVTSHSYMMGLLAMFFAPHLRTPVDMAKVYEMIMVHDLPEAQVGDTSVSQTANNVDAKAAQKDRELSGLSQIIGIVTPEIGSKISSLWHEFEEGKTPEAKLVRALDSLEVITQALQYPDIRYWGDYGDGKIYYQIVLDGRRRSRCAHEPILAAALETLITVTKKKMLAAGLNPADYVGQTAGA